MENYDIRKIWKSADGEIKLKTTTELSMLLENKIKKNIGKFILILSIDISVCSGLIAFLVITLLSRLDDIFYILNNSLLILFTFISLISSIISIKKLSINKNEKPLKEWLEKRINTLSVWLTGRYSKVYFFIIPVILIMIILSIHIFFEHKPTSEVLREEDSLISLAFGFITALFVSFYAVGKIRRSQMNNLNNIKELYKELEED